MHQPVVSAEGDHVVEGGGDVEYETETLGEGGMYGEGHILDPKKQFSCSVECVDSRGMATIGAFPLEAFQSIQYGDEDFNARLAILKKVTIFR